MAKQVFELFGFLLSDQSETATQARRTASCPFTGGACDGGGNRYQTSIRLRDLPETDPLRQFFADSGRQEVVPGICSIWSEAETWVVCPRRLFGFRLGGVAVQPHERDAIRAMGLPTGVPVGVWSEVSVNWKQRASDDGDESEAAGFDYNFDYVLAPLQPVSASALAAQFPAESVGDVPLSLSSPVIVEVMTASTSGSKKAKGTDIASVFRRAVLNEVHEAPGINKRQVWGRMATQLFAKSAAAEAWHGRTYWLLQDRFLTDIEKSTEMSTARIAQASATRGGQTGQDEINLVIFDVDARTGATSYRGVLSGDSGLSYRQKSQTFTGILLPNRIPPKRELLRAMLRKPPLCTLVL